MPSALTSLQPPNHTITLQDTHGVSRPRAILPLALGENLNVLVLSRGVDRKTLLQIKNSTLLAECPFPLQIGETLTVCVDQLHPKIILQMIPRENNHLSKANESLKLYRSHPDALREMITSVLDFVSQDHLKELANYLPKKDIQYIIKLLDKIIISKNNITNPLFLKDSLIALGLAGERRLMNALSNPAILTDELCSPTLKEVLLKLSSKLSSILITGEHAEYDGGIIEHSAKFADYNATVIESLQIVNTLAQERDGLFVFQLPFQFLDKIRMQDIFVEINREKNDPGSGTAYRVVLFLDMDALGELAIDTRIQDRTLRCVFKCSNPHVLDFIQTLLPELHTVLSKIDYTTGSMQCILEKDIQSLKNDYLQNHHLFSQNVIDECV
jgi:hypothetical protein